MTKEEQDKLAKEVEETFLGGGGFAHNLIALSLQKLAKFDKPRADAIYADLCERGF